MEDKFTRTVTETAKMRVLHVLMVLYERFGSMSESGEHMLELPLSRQDLAALVGITPESMSRTIRRLENEGLAQFEGRRVRLANMDNLLEVMQLMH